MCGRAVVHHNGTEIAEWLDSEPTEEIPKRYNLAPTDPILAMGLDRKVRLVRWGLTTLRNARAQGFNAKAESIGLYASMSRVLVIVSGFYEWRRVGGSKQPFYVYRIDGKPLVVAGFEDVGGVATVTCPANGVMLELHDRMPVVLERADFARYLAPSTRHDSLFESASARSLAMHPVGDSVSRVTVDGAPNDHAGLIDRVKERTEGTTAKGRQLNLF
jgi:putative SOS response-associated peptidase YedK